MTRTAWEKRAPDAYWKQDDTAPAISEQLQDGLGAPVNLTGATVRFIGRLKGAATVTIDQPATIVGSPTNGTVSYTPQAADTDTIGDLLVEWKVTFSGGAIERFPNSDWQKVRVRQRAG